MIINIIHAMTNSTKNILFHIFIDMKRFALTLFLLFGLVYIGFSSGDQDITINSSATSTTGTWTVTGSSVPYSYTFQPNAASNVANLNVADIVACFTGSNTTLGGGGTPPNTNGKAGNVTILTASTGAGAGTGNITISQPISQVLSNANQLTLTITAAGAINVSNTIFLKGNTGGTPGYPGANVSLNSGTGVSVSGGSGITTDGGAATGGNGGTAGVITITATTGNVNLSIASSAIGGAGNGSGAGGSGGNLTLTSSAGTSTLGNTFSNAGGTGGATGAGGNGGALTIFGLNGATINVACNTNGGNGGGAGSGGNAGSLTMSAPAGAVTLSNTFTTNGGTGGATGNGGTGGVWNLTALSSVSITAIGNSSNGGNGGATSGNGGNGGAMTFTSSASNVNFTNSLNAIGGNASAGNSSGGNGGAIIIYSATNFSSPNGFGNDISTQGGNATGTGSSGSGANITLTGNAANGGLTLGRTYTTSAGTGGSGTSGSAGTLSVSTGNSVVSSGGNNDGQSGSGYPTITTSAAPFTKTGTGVFLLGSTNNNYSGLTTVSAGTLKIGANNALGTNSNGTNVSNGATIDINNINYTTTEALSITGTGVSNLGALTSTTAGNSATWAGVVTISGGTSIGAVTGATLNISGQITGSGGLTKADYGILSVTSTSNNYTGSTTITTGTLQIGAAGVIPDANAMILNGGTLRTNGAFSEIMGTLTVNAGSFLAFGSVSAHTLTFANSNGITWGSSGNITITGWQGTYGAGTTGTTKFIVGTTANVLTTAQLAKIQFVDVTTGAYWTAQSLSNGEIVPSTSATGNTFYAIANGNWNTNTTWSYTSGGAAVPSGIFPTSTKNVVISSSFTVTLTTAAACNNITFGSGASGLTMALNNLTVFGNLNIVTTCPAISTTGGTIIFDGTNNSSQILTSTCIGATLGNVTLTNGANITSSGGAFSTTNFTCSSGTSSWINNATTGSAGVLTVTGILAASSCNFISNTAPTTAAFNFSGATNSPITVGGLISNSTGTINLGAKNTTISSLLSYASGTITSTGTISMAANAVITANAALTIANLQLGGIGVSSNGGGTLTATIFDFNGQTSFTQTAGIITTPTINNNTGPISMAYSGTPTFIYSGSGVIPSGSYYNLTTTTNTKSVTCSSTITVNGVLTNSSGTIVGPASAGQFGRFVNANPVNNIGGTIGSASTNLSFSGTIQGGTIIGAGTNVLQSSAQSASCTFYTLSLTSISGYSYCQGAGPSTSQNFTISGSGLTGSGNVVVTGSTDYEVSSDNITFGASASYPFASGIITGQPKTVYVRLKTGLTSGTYNSENVTVTSAGGATAQTVSNSGSVTLACPKTWTGAASTDWNTAGNWSPALLPTSIDDVTIPNVTKMPVIASGATGNAKGITINSGSSVTVNSTGTLNAYGSITNNGTYTANSGSTLGLLGSTAQTITGILVLYNVQINNSAGVSLLSAITVKGALTLTSGILTTGSNLTINFDNGGNIAYNVSDAGSISGNVTGTRNLIARTHYIASPFSGVTSVQVQATTPLFVNPYWKMYTKTFSTGGWAAVTDVTTSMPLGTGFSLSLPSTAALTFTGTYNHAYTLPGATYSNAVAGKYILVGNPYPSTLDWSVIYNGGSGTISNVAGAIYYWAPATSQVSSWAGGVGAGNPVGTQYVPAMQAFMVTTTGSGGNSSVSINNSARTSLQNPSFLRVAFDETIRIKLQTSDTSKWDDAVVRFNNMATVGFDNDFDSRKMLNQGSAPSIYTTLGSDMYSINSVADPASLPVIPVAVKLPVDGTYTLSIVNSDPRIEYVLVDKKLGTENALTVPYVFSGSTTDDVNRFRLQLRISQTTGTQTANAAAGLHINSSTKGFVIQTNQFSGEAATIEILDVTGKIIKVLSDKTLSNGVTYVPLDMADGAYIVKVLVDGTVFSQLISLVK